MTLAEPTLVADGLLARDGSSWVLRGGRCDACGEWYFPLRGSCTRCGGSAVSDVSLGSSGTLWSWTIQSFLPKAPFDSGETPASFAPYGVGYVELASGLKVEARLTVSDPARLRIGMPMVLALDAYRRVPEMTPVHTYCFMPADAAGQEKHHA